MAYERKEQLARSITLALTTGLFSIVPVVAEGAPVVDRVVTSGTSVEQNGKVTDVTSTVQNNIVNWKDFSVARDETVRFDQGAQTNNYLNVVTGSKQSEIAGKVEGGKNVYIVNQHGVLIDKDATVNVGNLYVSTTTDTLDTKDYLATGASPLVNTASTAAADVTNMGKIQADTVTVEGGTIKFLDTADVSAKGANVTLTANNEIKLGHQATTATSSTGIRRAMANPSGTAYRTNTTPTDYTVITNQSELQAINNDPSKNYWLKNDISMSDAFTPISNFSGVLDGNFYAIDANGVNWAGGLFLTITGVSNENRAKVYDLGLKNVNVSKGSQAYVGALASSATNADITNVYVAKGGTVAGGRAAGGILGTAKNTTLKSAYNKADVAGGAGLAANLAGNVKIQDAYNTGAVNFGFVNTSTDKKNYLINVYDDGRTSGSKMGISASGNITKSHAISITSSDASDYMTASAFTSLKEESGYTWADISSSGEDNKDGTATTWRIYEGQSLPLLRAFLRANGQVQVDYNYKMGDSSTFDYAQSGSNGGKDITPTYNSKALEVDGDPTYTNLTYTGEAVASGKISKSKDTIQYITTETPETVALFYTDQDGYDLVGNNVTLQRRKVNLATTDYSGRNPLTKVYDGTVAVNQTKLTNYLTSSSGDATESGLVFDENGELDGTVLQSANTLKGTYNSKNVADAKTITVNGTLGYDNKPGYCNYDFGKENSAKFTNLEIKGAIEKKDLTIAFKNTNPTRTYNGKKNSAVADGYRLTGGDDGGDTDGKIFTLTDKVTKSDTGADGSTHPDKDDTVYVGTTEANGTGDYGTGTGADFVATGKASQTEGDRSVQYKGITLKGADAGNYNITNLNADGAYYGTGTIRRLNIDSKAFSLPDNTPAEKTYDSTAYLDKAVGEDLDFTGKLTDDSLAFTVTKKDGKDYAAWFTTDGTDEISDAGKNYNVAYNVKVTGDDAENYTLDNKDLTVGGMATVMDNSGKGEIKQRVITLGLGEKSTDINKTYNNNADVTVKNDFSDGLIAYSDKSTTVSVAKADAKKTGNTDKLITEDGVTFKIVGAYQKTGDETAAKDVRVGTDGTVIENGKNITYTITLDGGDKVKNYALVAEDGTSQTLTGATGTINKREISSVAIAPVSKTFDWSSATGSQDGDKLTAGSFTLGNLADGESAGDVITESVLDTLNDGKHGTYGEEVNGVFTPNEHAGTHTARYTGVTSGNTNYTIKDSTVDTTGTIHQLTIDNIAIQTGEITKTYDGKTNVATYNDDGTVAKPASSYLTDVTTTVAGTEHSIKYATTVADSDGAYYITDSTSGTATKDVLTAKKARFLLNITTDSDFKLADNISGLQGDGRVARDTADSTKASITPKTVYASVTHTAPFSKTYDATTSVYDTKTGTGITAGEDSVKIAGLIDGDGATNTSTGAFDDKNVAYETGTDTIKAKDVTYTISLNNGKDDQDTVQGNYAVYDAANHNRKLDYGDAATDKLTGTGIITPAALTAEFADIKKVYDANTDVAGTAAKDGTKAESQFKKTLDGIITPAGGTEDNVTINAEIADAHFTDASKGTDKTITYTFTLDGNDLRNYKLTTLTHPDGQNVTHANEQYTATTDTNTIEAKTIGKKDIQVDWGTVQKTYDGGTNVAYDHTDTNTYFDEDDVVSGTDSDGNQTSTKVASRDAKDFVHGITFGDIPVSGYSIENEDASYDNAAAGKQTAMFKFQLTKDVLDNYEFESDVDDILTQNTNGTGTLTASTTGTIMQKTLNVAFDDNQGGNAAEGAITKVYNGSTNIVTNAQDDLKSGAPSDSSLFMPKFEIKGLVNGETQGDVVNISGAYAGKDVGTTQIDYALTTNAHSNYKLVGTNAASSTEPDAATGVSSVTYQSNTGSITPKHLTLDFAALEKTYDTKADVATSALKDEKPTISPDLTGFVGTEGVDFSDDDAAVALLKGEYGTWNAAKRTIDEDPDVNWDSTNKQAKSKSLVYTGIDKAFDQLKKDYSDILKNYTLEYLAGEGANAQFLSSQGNGIKDTVYFAEAANKGKIKRLALTMDNIKTRWNPYSRQYDGTDKIEDPTKALTLYVDSIGSNNEIPLNEVDIDYEGSAKFSQSDAGKGLKITATVTSVSTDKTAKNFDLSSINNLTALNTTYTNDKEYKAGSETGARTPDGAITQRQIIAVVDKGTDLDKTYDGTTALKDAAAGKVRFVHQLTDEKGNVIGIDNDIIVKDDNHPTVTADSLQMKSVDYAKQVNGKYTADKNAAENKSILFTAVVDGDTAGNYVFANDSLVHYAGDDFKEAATGTVNQRTVYVDFTNGQPTNVIKTYDGKDDTENTTGATSKADVQNAVSVLTATEGTKPTGIAPKDQGTVTLATGKISVRFGKTNGEDAENVNRSAEDWSVQEKNVEVSGFRLENDGDKNYVVLVNPHSQYVLKQGDAKVAGDTGILLAKGRIDPIQVTAALKDTPVTKVYDGTKNVVDFTDKNNVTHTYGTDNLQLTPDTLVGNQTVNATLKSAEFNSEHVQDADTATYTYDWTNRNYELAKDNLNSVKTLKDKGNAIGQEVTLQTTGKITPREITVAGATDASKTYDGTTAVRVDKDGSPEAVGKNILFDNVVTYTAADGTTTSDDVGAKATGTYLETATGKGDAADASTDGGTDLLTHDVKYTGITIDNPDYVLSSTSPKETTGKGTIDRATLTLTGDKRTFTTGSKPIYDGTTTGWQNDEDQDKALRQKWKDSLTWNGNPGDDTSRAGSYAVNGWYKNETADGITGTTVKEQDPDDSTITIETTTYANAGATLGTKVVRYRETTAADPDDPTKTVKNVLSTTKTFYNPVNANIYTVTVTDAEGKVTSRKLIQKVTGADGLTSEVETPITEANTATLANWYGSDSNGTAYAYQFTDDTNEPTSYTTYALSGNFDKNYTFVQYEGNAEAGILGNDKALTIANPSHHGGGGGGGGSRPVTPVTPVTPDTPDVPDTPVTPVTPDTPDTPDTPTTVPDISSEVNADKQFRPDMNAYNHASQDDVGTVIRDPKVGIEYQSGGTSLSTDGSGTYQGLMTVEGAGDIVNLDAGGTTTSAERIDLTGEGAAYAVEGAENVPTASVAIEEDTSAQEADAGIETAAGSDVTSSDTVLDDDENLIASMTGTDEHEAEAAIEQADMSVSLFDDAIVGDDDDEGKEESA